MLPFCNDRDRERQVICRKHTKEMKELEGKHHTELKAFDDRKAKEEMKLQAFCKEQAKELAYEGLLVRKVLQVSLSFFAIMLLDILSLSPKKNGREKSVEALSRNAAGCCPASLTFSSPTMMSKMRRFFCLNLFLCDLRCYKASNLLVARLSAPPELSLPRQERAR